MQIKQLILLIGILTLGCYCSCSNSQQFLLYSAFDTDTDPEEWDFSEWNLGQGTDQVPFHSCTISECDGNNLVGGYRQFGRHTRISRVVPTIHYPATTITIEFKFFAIDSWETGDFVEIYLDGILIHRIEKFWEDDEKEDLCGNTESNRRFLQFSNTGDFSYQESFSENLTELGYRGLDSGPSLRRVLQNDDDDDYVPVGLGLEIVSGLDEGRDDESFGFNNFNVFFNLICDENGCLCPKGYYWDNQVNECKKCFYKCAECSDWHTCTECEQEEGNPFQRVLPTCWCEYNAEDVDGSCTEPSCPEGQYLSNKNAYVDQWECKNCMQGCKKCNSYWSCQECVDPAINTWNCQ